MCLLIDIIDFVLIMLKYNFWNYYDSSDDERPTYHLLLHPTTMLNRENVELGEKLIEER